MRIIDADALEKVYVRNSITDTVTVGEKTVLRHLREATTIDAVPVVRCKDCKSYDTPDGWGWCYENDRSVIADDFCSYGERRSE